MDSKTIRVLDALFIAFMQAYAAARAKLASHPSPVLRIQALRDQASLHAKLLERELAIFREERLRLPPRKRPDYTPNHRLQILQLMRLRNWSVAQTADRFVLHVNTLRAWRCALDSDGRAARLFTGPAWNKIHDAVRYAVTELRDLCPDLATGSRTIARLLVHAGIQIHRSSVQRILREKIPTPRKRRQPLLPAEGREPFNILKPRRINAVWHLDLTTLKIPGLRFTLIAILDGFSRRILALRIHRRTPTTDTLTRLVSRTARRFGAPRFLVTDHGGQFQREFKKRLAARGIAVVQGKVRCPAFNGKVERFFRTLKLWLRLTLLPVGPRAAQKRLDRYAHWYNVHRPHAALGCRTPQEAWGDTPLPTPIPFRAADPGQVHIDVRRHLYHHDPDLPVISIRVHRKEAA